MLTVFNIQRYSVHDGEGVRTNIFFKGCQLHCLWCNNPEGIDPNPSVMFDERVCQRFGDCINAGNGQIVSENNKLLIDRENLSDINILRSICPSKALIVSGQEMMVEQIIKEIEKDIPFFTNSEGGVTITGGEPLLQGPELTELLIALKNRGINISAETSLHLPWEIIENYIDKIDMFLADMKHVDIEKFARYTGGDATLVMDNFRKLDKTGKSFIVRVPVIPQFNFSRQEMYAIIDFASGLKSTSEINFIPYHSLAREKYTMLGKVYNFGDYGNVEKGSLKQFTDYASQKGLIAKILN